MTALYAALAALGYLWAFWLLYVLTMGLYRASLAGKLTRMALVLGSPFVILAIAADLLANWTLATLWFYQWPAKSDWPRISFSGWRPAVVWVRPDLVTSRLSRYIDGPDCWRKEHATWLCHNLLDAFDPSGTHCKN